MTGAEQLAAEHECNRLILTYARLMDACRWDEVAALYVEEGRMNRPSVPDDFVVGRGNILATFKARPPRIARHICANIVVDLVSDTEARAQSAILLYTGTAAEDGGLPPMAAGSPLVGGYADILRLTPEGWRFYERRGSMDFRA